MSHGAIGFAGSIPALVTPFRREDGAIDSIALAGLAARAVARGSSGVVVCGSTGEGPALTAEEHAGAVRVVAQAVGARVPVIAGVGAPCTEAAIQLAQAAERAGAAALLCGAPPYVKPGQEGLFAHVRAIATASGLPIMLYDVPSRAGVAFADATIARLREAGLIHALKDASGDLSRVPRLRALCGRDFPQLSGDDATALAHLAMGGAGCVSVSANVAPALCAALQQAWVARDMDRAAEIRDGLAPLDAVLFAETNPIPVKAALGLLGLADAMPRLPLLLASQATRQRLCAVLAEVMALEDGRARAIEAGAPQGRAAA
ncbi:4-hydroxy-tetrahydrodipicolinate synthase [Plastoroseomonas arctica]|uniref:4-hydroxy-tetrahydrodipicolinate synthase n=1 Tax=Plastoroseomonas arctica TaxID=1509237 RepID=A0AAF1JTD7_9PROT|nr:4-hydroxy-tetrahydrodipicolinate synthase [Plastoroseomonas arctica]